MAVKMGTRLDRLKAAVTEFEAAQAKYSEFGARDTEPDGVFQRYLAKSLTQPDIKLPTTGEQWQLFTSTMACGNAARALTAALRKAVAVVRDCPVRELPAIRAYLRDYCWRSDVD